MESISNLSVFNRSYNGFFSIFEGRESSSTRVNNKERSDKFLLFTISSSVNHTQELKYFSLVVLRLYIWTDLVLIVDFGIETTNNPEGIQSKENGKSKDRNLFFWRSRVRTSIFTIISFLSMTVD